MDKDDIFILSAGHCALALYVCLEKYHGIDAEIAIPEAWRPSTS